MEGLISKQLYSRMIDIQHEQMPEIVEILRNLLVNNDYNPKFYHRLWKSLFFALWNYDKMYNQHLFCEEISNLIHSLSIEKVEHFLLQGLDLLDKYWNRIDHHRINKFMKLIRYLIRQSHIFWRNNNIAVSRLQQILKTKIFYELEQCNGLRFHVLDIYPSVLIEAGIDIKKQIQYLDILRQLLFESTSKTFREHIVQKVYEKVKGLLQIQQILSLIEDIRNRATEVEDDSLRRTLYNLLGFLKSQDSLYIYYRQRKLENAEKQMIKSKKKISKGKKKQILQKKNKRKIVNKLKKKKGDIMSKRKIQMVQA